MILVLKCVGTNRIDLLKILALKKQQLGFQKMKDYKPKEINRRIVCLKV
jgi:hypothetical protein